MKIKIKKHNIINEGTPNEVGTLPLPDSLDNENTPVQTEENQPEDKTEDQQEQSSVDAAPKESAKDNTALKNMAKRQFEKSRKMGALGAQIIMPSACAQLFMIPKAPLDLRNLMQDIPTGGGEKQQNIRGMLHDPSKTFDHATDYAKTIFGQIDRVQFSDKKTNESYNYMNEGEVAVAATTGAVKAGAAVGSVTGVGMNALTGGILAGASSFLATAAPSIAAIYGVGYLGGALLTDVKEGGIIDDSKLKNSNLNTNDDSDENSDQNWKSQNTIEAIDQYLTNLSSALGKVLADIAGGKEEKYDEIREKISTYIAASDKQVEEYIKENSGILKEIKKANEAKKSGEVKTLKNSITISNKITLKIISEIGNNPSAISTESWTRILNYLQNLSSDTSGDSDDILDEFAQATNIKEIKNIYNRHHNRQNQITDAYVPNYTSLLFEDEETTDDEQLKLKPIDLEPYYKNIKSEFLNLINPMFPIKGGSKLPRIEEAKKSMDELIKGATEEINTKIDHVCRLSNAGQNLGLSDKVSSFLSKHPLKAATLKNTWNRHVAELNGRRDARLEQMADYEKIDYITGWAANLCKVVVPEVIARMFTYRYALQLLVDNDFYSYDSNHQAETKEMLDEASDEITNQASYQVLWFLMRYGHLYTENGNPMVIATSTNESNNSKYSNNNVLNEAGEISNMDLKGFEMGQDKPSYITFLIYNLVGGPYNILYKLDNFETYNGVSSTMTIISNYDNINNFVSNIIELSNIGGNNILDQEQMDELEQKFSDISSFEQHKDLIKSTYDYILNVDVNDYGKNDTKKTLNYILSHPNFVNGDLDIDKLKPLIEEYNKDKNEELAKLILDILNVTEPLNNVDGDLEDFKSYMELVKGESSKLDLYGLVLYVYTSLKLNNIYDFSPIENVSDICKIIKNTLFLLSTNVLNVGNETPEFVDKVEPFILADKETNVEDKVYDYIELSVPIDTLKNTDISINSKDIYDKIDEYCKDPEKLEEDYNTISLQDKQKNDMLKDLHDNSSIDIKLVTINGKNVESIKEILTADLDKDDIVFSGSPELTERFVNYLKFLVTCATYYVTDTLTNKLYDLYTKENINTFYINLEITHELINKEDNSLYLDADSIKTFNEYKENAERIDNVDDNISKLIIDIFKDKSIDDEEKLNNKIKENKINDEIINKVIETYNDTNSEWRKAIEWLKTIINIEDDK